MRSTHLPGRHRDMQWKEPCRVAATASVTISTGLNAGDVIDGVTLAAGDRVLLPVQSTGSQNGIYIAGVTPARAEDMDTSTEVLGAVIYVIAGTTNGGKIFCNTNLTAVTLGTTALTFAAYSAGGGGGGSLTVELLGGTGAVASVATVRVAQLFDHGGGDVDLLPMIIGTGGGFISFDSTGISIYSPDGWNTGGGAQVYVNDDELELVAPHTPGDVLEAGLHVQVGSDLLDLYISEKNNDTVQFYEGGSGYNFEFVELISDKFWKFVNIDGAVAIPGLGMLPQYSSAPHSGVEVEGESYYDTTLHTPRWWNGSAWKTVTGL